MCKFPRVTLLALPLFVTACVSIPGGPSITSFPGTGKNFDQFRVDDVDCRQYASTAIGDTSPAHAQADSAVKSAAVGTAIGALAGAAFGGHANVGAGAGVGLIVGALAGSASANASGYTAQRRYDNAYVQCMYAKGNKVPMASSTARYAAPVYYPAQPAPPVVTYSPPPSPGSYPPPPPSAYPPPPPPAH